MMEKVKQTENFNIGKIIPFFMAYPLEQYIDQQSEWERDRVYLTELYPVTAKKIQKNIEDELQLRDYRESILYDEYPDRLGLSLIANAVYERTEDTAGKEYVKDLIEVLLYQEVLRRRHHKKDMFYL